MKLLPVAALGLLAWSRLVAATPPPLPGALAPHVVNGRFEAGDFGWLRGAFAGASPAEAATYRAIVAWRDRCRADDLAATRSELAGLGVTPGASIESVPYRTLLCNQVASEPEAMDRKDWAAFQRDVAVVRPIARAYLHAVGQAEAAVPADSASARDALLARVVGDQALRGGLAWIQGAGPDAPGLSAQQGGILIALLEAAAAARDHANTAWLKALVARQGWPRRSAVGDLAASNAWLLVQHADADPAFQVRALRLMEPLVKSGEVSARNYAYLYDRTMLVVTGRQRYATQLTCRDGRFVPEPLEDEGAMVALRKEAGLEPFVAYQAQATKILGACQGAPRGR